MDILYLLLIIFGVPGVFVVGVVSGGGIFMAFIDPASMVVTVGGTLVAIFISTATKNWPQCYKLILVGSRPPKENPRDIIPTLVSFAEKARREGLLALEDNIEELDDEFLKKGIQLVVDGTDPELVKAIMATELVSLEARHESGSKILGDMGALAPAWGMIGTLIGLVIMLGNLEDPKSIGSGMATALITTLYGAILANGVFLPCQNRLAEYSSLEYTTKEVMIEGMLSIQSGDNPRIVQEKLLAFLSPSERVLARTEETK
ncbi:MAG: motility protein A [Candidatus Lindowbacteria bacterium]|nr:motility protein A [Candidatus Lindowbacteria bacterium]